MAFWYLGASVPRSGFLLRRRVLEAASHAIGRVLYRLLFCIARLFTFDRRHLQHWDRSGFNGISNLKLMVRKRDAFRLLALCVKLEGRYPQRERLQENPEIDVHISEA